MRSPLTAAYWRILPGVMRRIPLGEASFGVGAGSGFGEGIARKFVAEGAKVLLVDLRGEAAERAAAAAA